MFINIHCVFYDIMLSEKKSLVKFWEELKQEYGIEEAEMASS